MSDYAASNGHRPRILCVDDEPRIIEGMTRLLRTEFAVTGATSGLEALNMLAAEPPFEVIVCDMRMPVMDGSAVLREALLVRPYTTRILLTGQADMADAMNAVNQGNIFRFLFKPCPPDILKQALHNAVEHHKTMTAERQLLEETLKGAVEALLETLSLANPMAFARATRIQQTVQQLCETAQPPDRWCIEVAAMVSQIGCIVLPPDTLHKLNCGLRLNAEEELQVRAVPWHAERLLAHIPRLEPVREIIQRQATAFDEMANGPSVNGNAGNKAITVGVGAQMLRLAIDLETLEAAGLDRLPALSTLECREGTYNPALIDALRTAAGPEMGDHGTFAITPSDLRPGMTIAQDVRDSGGRLLVGRGYRVTDSLIERFRNWETSAGIQEPIFVHRAGSPE